MLLLLVLLLLLLVLSVEMVWGEREGESSDFLMYLIIEVVKYRELRCTQAHRSMLTRLARIDAVEPKFFSNEIKFARADVTAARDSRHKSAYQTSTVVIK